MGGGVTEVAARMATEAQWWAAGRPSRGGGEGGEGDRGGGFGGGDGDGGGGGVGGGDVGGGVGKASRVT